jgi:hypothetical protein
MDNYIENITIVIGGMIFGKMDMNQIILSHYLYNKSIIYDYDFNTTTIPLCFSLFIDYLPVLFLWLHYVNIVINYGDKKIYDVHIFATNIQNKEILSIRHDMHAFLMTQNIGPLNSRNLNINIGLISFDVILSQGTYLYFIKGLDYEKITNIRMSVGVYFFDLKYIYCCGGVLLPIDENFDDKLELSKNKSLDNFNNYNYTSISHGSFSDCVSICINTHENIEKCKLQIYSKSYNMSHWANGTTGLLVCT